MIGLLLYRFCGTPWRFRLERLLGVEFKSRCYHGRVMSTSGCGACLRDARELALGSTP